MANDPCSLRSSQKLELNAGGELAECAGDVVDGVDLGIERVEELRPPEVGSGDCMAEGRGGMSAPNPRKYTHP